MHRNSDKEICGEVKFSQILNSFIECRRSPIDKRRGRANQTSDDLHIDVKQCENGKKSTMQQVGQ